MNRYLFADNHINDRAVAIVTRTEASLAATIKVKVTSLHIIGKNDYFDNYDTRKVC